MNLNKNQHPLPSITKVGLSINFSKKEIMIWNSKENNDGTYPESMIKIQDMELLNTEHFKYLGSVIANLVMQIRK